MRILFGADFGFLFKSLFPYRKECRNFFLIHPKLKRLECAECLECAEANHFFKKIDNKHFPKMIVQESLFTFSARYFGM